MDKHTVSVDLIVNGEKARRTIEDITQNLNAAKQQKEDLLRAEDFKGAQQMDKTIRGLERDLKQAQSSAANVAYVMTNLDKATPRELRITLRQLNKEIDDMEQGSDAWKEHVEKIGQVKAALESVNEELEAAKELNSSDIFEGFGEAVDTVVSKITEAYESLLSSVEPYAEMQEQLAETRKFTGLTTEEVEELNEAFKRMDTRTSREQLNMLAQEAGRLGKNTIEEVQQYVEAADIINVALNDLGEGATETVYKLASIFKIDRDLGTRDAMLAIGSTVNTLSQNTVVSSSYLVDFSQRMAGVGATAKLSASDILAYAATLSTAGQQVEVSSSALGRLTMKLFQDPAKIAKTVGLDVKEFTDLLNRDTNAALIMFLERIRGLGDKEGLALLAPMFKEMGANGVGLNNVIMGLANNLDTLKEQQQLATQAFEDANSVQQEFAIGNETVQARLDRHKKDLDEVAVALGETLMPVMDAVIKGTASFSKVITALLRFLKDYGAYILTVVAAIGAYTVVVKASAIAEGIHTAAIWLKQKALLAAQRAQIAFNAAAKANPWGLMAAAIAAVVAALAVYKLKHKELTAEQRLDADIKKQVIQQYGEQKGKIDLLNQAVHDETRSLAERRKALNELRAIVPDYHAELTNEGKLINNNKTAIEKYLTALKAQMVLQAYKDKLQEAYNRRAELDMQAEEKQKTRLQAELAFQKERATEIINMGYDFAKEYTPEGFALKEAETALDNIYDQLAETDALIKAIDEKIRAVKKAGSGGVPLVVNGEGNGTPAGDATITGNGTPDSEAQQWRQRELALLEIAYHRGQILHEQYTQKKLETERDYQQRLMDSAKEGSTEYLQAEAAKLKAEKDLGKHAIDMTVEQEQQRYRDTQRILHQRYAYGEINTKTYHRALQTAELDHLQNLAYIYEDGSQEQLKAQDDYIQASVARQKEYLQEQERLQQEFLKRQQDFRRDYFAEAAGPDPGQYADEKAALDALYDTLRAHASTREEQLAIDQAYYRASYDLAKKYGDDAAAARINSLQAVYDKMDLFSSKEAQQAMNTASSTMSAVSQMMSGITDYMNAELELQTANVENRYDAEIKAAGDNTAKVERLEEQKQAEISKLKSQAADKQFKMQVFTAVAEGAMAAINAWNTGLQAGFPAGIVLAPLLMALSIATTAVQIASLKKQQQAAAATGYAQGGYTRKGRKNEPAGIVHAGEWVASQELLANPQTAAIISALDTVQRTNTIGSLTPYRHPLTNTQPPTRIHQQEVTNTQPPTRSHQHEVTNTQLERTLQRLDRRLREPFVTVNTVSGDRGIKRAQDRYDRLTKKR